MRTLDLTPLMRATVGFDHLQRALEAASRHDDANAYPPYNIEKTGEDTYRVSLAVAGFGEDDLEIVEENGILKVVGHKVEEEVEETRSFLHRGIAGRSFERRFQLADHVRAVDARMENGLLHIDLKREVPEALKPRTIAIAAGSGPKKLTSSKAA